MPGMAYVKNDGFGLFPKPRIRKRVTLGDEQVFIMETGIVLQYPVFHLQLLNFVIITLKQRSYKCLIGVKIEFALSIAT